MSRFAATSRYRLDDGGQTSSRRVANSTNYIMHTVQAGETVESIAYSVLGSFQRWWEIADLNPQIQHVSKASGGSSLMTLTPGSTIRIPIS